MTTESGKNPEPATPSEPPKAGLLQLIRIVISMLFMIGRNKDYGATAPTIDPVQLIFVGIIGAALLIAGLVSLAMFIAR